jgi:hypothetical protein
MKDITQSNPSSPLDFKSLANSIVEGIVELYRIGGLILVWIFIGTFLMMSAMVAALASGEHIIAYIAGGVGALIIIGIFIVYLIMRQRADNEVKKSEEFVDTALAIAYEMTNFVGQLQSLAFKYEKELGWLISEALDNELPLPSAIQTNDPRFAQIEGVDLKKLQQEFSSHYKQLIKKYMGEHNLTVEEGEKEEKLRGEFNRASIVQFTQSARAIIEEVKSVLTSDDPRPLKDLLERVKGLNTDVVKLLID